MDFYISTGRTDTRTNERDLIGPNRYAGDRLSNFWKNMEKIKRIGKIHNKSIRRSKTSEGLTKKGGKMEVGTGKKYM